MPKLIAEMIPDFSWLKRNLNFRQEFLAAFIGAILTIPQAITFAYLAGLPPEYGLYCAVYTTLIACLFGSSMMVGGPNAAVSMLLGAAVLPFAGTGSPLYINFVLILSFMVGIAELCLWLSRSSRIFQYFSPVLINAITTGVGVLILSYSLDGITGSTGIQVNFFYEKLYIIISGWQGISNYYAFLVGFSTIVTGLIFKKKYPRFYILAALLIGTLVGLLLNGLYGIPNTELDLLGYMPLKMFDFKIIMLDWEYISIYIQLAVSAMIIALIAISQTMIIINELKINANTPIDANKDIYAQGIANISSVFFGAFCGGGSFNRTRLNRTFGSRSKLATILSCFIIIFLVDVFSEIIAYIPMATMSGLLFLVGLEMIKINAFKQALERKSDGISFIITFCVVILINLESGLLIAFILSVLTFVYRISEINIEISENNIDNINKVTIHGCLFFGTFDDLLQIFRDHSECKLQLDLRDISYLGPGPAQLIIQEKKKRASSNYEMTVLPPSQWCAGFPLLLK